MTATSLISPLWGSNNGLLHPKTTNKLNESYQSPPHPPKPTPSQWRRQWPHNGGSGSIEQAGSFPVSLRLPFINLCSVRQTKGTLCSIENCLRCIKVVGSRAINQAFPLCSTLRLLNLSEEQRLLQPVPSMSYLILSHPYPSRRYRLPVTNSRLTVGIVTFATRVSGKALVCCVFAISLRLPIPEPRVTHISSQV
jgi:hypothetical protein